MDVVELDYRKKLYEHVQGRGGSACGQDQFVVRALGAKTEGYFVEAGAVDGRVYSNTLLFEQVYGWQGICVEPHDLSFKLLQENRRCFCANDCLGDGSVIVYEPAMVPFVGQSKVETRSTPLVEILRRYDAPTTIDYLSLDVEGHEYTALKDFPFNEYKFLTVTIEILGLVNGHPMGHSGRGYPSLPEETFETDVHKLLVNNGYILSERVQDDNFYVHESIVLPSKSPL
jgi:hypothetical protein